MLDMLDVFSHFGIIHCLNSPYFDVFGRKYVREL